MLSHGGDLASDPTVHTQHRVPSMPSPCSLNLACTAPVPCPSMPGPHSMPHHAQPPLRAPVMPSSTLPVPSMPCLRSMPPACQALVSYTSMPRPTFPTLNRPSIPLHDLNMFSLRSVNPARPAQRSVPPACPAPRFVPSLRLPSRSLHAQSPLRAPSNSNPHSMYLA